ncbi:hypothetical protein VMT65_29360 [Nocardia sp. CDC153]|uniref:hypothetical protein n=1 Tax=Nocardia sp. CDC153 TaxID=3112167 RepID=UPI002DB9CB89|nr:hypothetical protein [Nocardia sp. CDC153]MEC3957175.1 hypothetical protein [Nocardia sp. CDC153]
MIVYDPRTERPPLARLKGQATRLDAEAVIVPNSNHFDGGTVPRDLVQQLDVITVDPQTTYARWSTGLVETNGQGHTIGVECRGIGQI